MHKNHLGELTNNRIYLQAPLLFLEYLIQEAWGGEVLYPTPGRPAAHFEKPGMEEWVLSRSTQVTLMSHGRYLDPNTRDPLLPLLHSAPSPVMLPLGESPLHGVLGGWFWMNTHADDSACTKKPFGHVLTETLRTQIKMFCLDSSSSSTLSPGKFLKSSMPPFKWR